MQFMSLVGSCFEARLLNQQMVAFLSVVHDGAGDAVVMVSVLDRAWNTLLGGTGDRPTHLPALSRAIHCLSHTGSIHM